MKQPQVLTRADWTRVTAENAQLRTQLATVTAGREALDADWKRRHTIWLEQQALEIAAHAETRKMLDICSVVHNHNVKLKADLESTRGELDRMRENENRRAQERDKAEARVKNALAYLTDKDDIESTPGHAIGHAVEVLRG